MAGAESKDLKAVVELLVRASRVVALTGAGISVESGIPAFRGAQGLWERYDPMEYAHIDAFRANPGKVWQMLKELRALIVQARPNPAHLALAEMERLGRLKAIITQNVDNLHQAAGSSEVIEFHGNGATLICLDCRRRFARAEVSLEELPPRCDCGGVLKPEVVFFGEMIPAKTYDRAVQAASSCDLMMVIGTSAQVAPASQMPWLALRSGAKVVEFNLEPTELTGRAAHYTLLGLASEVLPLVAARLRQALQS